MSKTKFNLQFTAEQIQQFEKLDIAVIYLFGSQAQGYARASSDIDIGVVFNNPERQRQFTLAIYNQLYRLFVNLPAAPTEIDLVFLQFASMKLQFRAANDGIVLYQASPAAHYQYRETVIKQHADLHYFYQLHQSAILVRA